MRLNNTYIELILIQYIVIKDLNLNPTFFYYLNVLIKKNMILMFKLIF